MDTTPEEEANPVLVAFKQLNTQLEKLDEFNRRAIEREQQVLQEQQAMMERQNKLNNVMLKILEKADNFQQNMVDVETRTKSYLSGYFKELPKSSTVVQRKEWGFDLDTKFFFYCTAFAMLFGAVGSYYFTSLSYIETVSTQRKLIREYEGNIEYLKSKIPALPAKTKKRKKN
jgi:hypothetical protein